VYNNAYQLRVFYSMAIFFSQEDKLKCDYALVLICLYLKSQGITDY